MARRVHPARELAQWQQGETRQVYARYQADPGRMYYLPDDTAERDREWLKANVECCIPGCANRALIPRSRARGRDHFGHHSGAGGHGPVSLSHEQGKYALTGWLATRQGHGALEIATERTLGRQAAIDVYASNGEWELAFEIQYSYLSPTEWRRRHAVYQRHHIADAWIWGHHGAHCQPVRDQPGKVRLSTAQREAAECGLPLLWLVPEHRLVLTGWVYQAPDGTCGRDLRPGVGGPCFQVSPGGHAEECWVSADPLDSCVLDAWGLLTPTRVVLQEQQAALQRATARRRQRAHARAQRDEQDRVAMATIEQREQTWQDHPLRQWLLNRYGRIPAALRGSAPTTRGIWAVPEHWHTIVYHTCIHGRDAGSRFTVVDCYRALRQARIPLEQPHHALSDYLDQLQRHDLITVHRSGRRIQALDVRHDLDHPPAAARSSHTGTSPHTTRTSTPVAAAPARPVAPHPPRPTPAPTPHADARTRPTQQAPRSRSSRRPSWWKRLLGVQ